MNINIKNCEVKIITGTDTLEINNVYRSGSSAYDCASFANSCVRPRFVISAK